MTKKRNSPPIVNDDRLVVMLPKSDKEAFRERANEKRLSMSDIARMLIADFLQKGDDK